MTRAHGVIGSLLVWVVAWSTTAGAEPPALSNAAAAAPAAAATAQTPKNPKISKGFWKVLVKPHAPWALIEDQSKPFKIVVETYDIRKVGDADVARLRWTWVDGKEKSEPNRCDDCFWQGAVTNAGLYFARPRHDGRANR
jgi:hypothetical protein